MVVKTAFLYGFIDQLIYIETPKGTEIETKNMVWKLLKALYGLKDSPRLCYKRFLFPSCKDRFNTDSHKPQHICVGGRLERPCA